MKVLNLEFQRFFAETMVNQGGVLRYEEKIADWCGWI